MHHMPFPSSSHPNYCPGSRNPLPDGYDPDAQWHRCEHCGRLIAEAGHQGIFHAHKNVPGRRGDRIQETLHAAGLNRRETPGPIVYADPEK